MRAKVEELGDLGFVQHVRERMLGRKISVSGRSIVDDQGAMVLADGFEIEAHDAQMRASELRAQWGWADGACKNRSPASPFVVGVRIWQRHLNEKDPANTTLPLSSPNSVPKSTGSSPQVCGAVELRETSNGSSLYQGQLRDPTGLHYFPSANTTLR